MSKHPIYRNISRRFHYCNILFKKNVDTFFCVKPDRPDELERVEAAGGRIINWDGHRVLGVLATSRSIGMHR